MNKKLALIESVNRWIEIYTYFHYPDEVREEAYQIAYLNRDKQGYPHMLAATAIYIACGNKNIVFNFKLLERITIAHKKHKSKHPGLKFDTIKRGRILWKLPKQ